MVKDHKELKKVCGELNLNVLKQRIEVEYKKYLKNLETIKDEALQWAKEIKEQHDKMVEQKKSSPLLPRTPTLKRTQRKRRLPAKLEEDADGKENSIAVGRQARAASQAATSKFYGQLHVPVKLRRPSESKKEEVPKVKKRVRVMSTSMESEDDAVSIASAAISVASEKPKSPPKKAGLRTRAKRVAAASVSESSGEEEEEPKMKTRGKKVQVVSPQEKKTHKKPLKKRKLAKKVEGSDSEDTPAPPETTHENLDSAHSDVATTEHSQEEADEPAHTPAGQPIKKNPKLVMSREVAIKMEKLSETFIMRQVGLNEEEDMDTENEVPSESQLEEEKSEEEAKEEEPVRRRSSRNKPAAEVKLPGKTPELQALTPHLAGRVKERVQAVEQSLQRGYPRMLIQHQEVASSSQPSDASPDPFEESHEEEEAHSSSPSVLRKRSDQQSAKKTISASMNNLAMTGTLPKSGWSRDVAHTKKMFELSSVVKKRRSRSWDQTLRRDSSHHSQLFFSHSKLPQTGTLGRSRIGTGKLFMTAALKEQAQLQAQEADKKKEEERQLREGKIQDATKKRVEMLKMKAEEKKRVNEEKRNKVKQQQEQRQKEIEAQQRKKEEAARQDEQKKLKERDDKAQKLLDMKAKREEKKKREDAKKAKEDEAKKVKEDEARKAKEEEMKKLETKKALEASKQKLLLMAKAMKPVVEPPKVGIATNNMNSTFTMPKEDACKTPKPANPAVSRLAQTDSYVVTPTRDELPPSKPKTEEDYGIDEVTEGDSSDDDEKPKKKVPSWAARLKGNLKLDCADYAKLAIRNNLFGTRVFKPTIQDLFGAGARQMTRRSSAVWNTPPNLHHMTLNASMLMD